LFDNVILTSVRDWIPAYTGMTSGGEVLCRDDVQAWVLLD